MTITSRGAVAPGGDRAGTGSGGPAADIGPSDEAALGALVDEVADHTIAWATTGAAARADLLQQVINDTMAAQDGWLAAACAAKGLTPGTTEAGEELFAGVGTFVRMARLLRDSLRAIAKDGKPSFAGPVREASDGRLRVQVFPANAFDRITFPQTTAEVWMQPGVTAANRSCTGRPPPTPTRSPTPARRSCWRPATWPRSARATCSPSSSWRARSWS